MRKYSWTKEASTDAQDDCFNERVILHFSWLTWKNYKCSRPYNIFNKINTRPRVQSSHTSTILARTDCPTKKDSDRSALGSSIALKRKTNKLQETKYANKHLTKKSHGKKQLPCFLGRNQSTDQENGQNSHFQSSYKHNPVYEFIKSKCKFMNIKILGVPIRSYYI